MAKEALNVGDFTTTKWTNDAVRPVIVTSVNNDGSVNGRVFDEPDDNPKRDGNYVAFVRNLKG